MFHGFLNLSKPAGMTSHDCVSRTRRLLNMKKVGHGGTLDPLATGVLPIALGHGTRFLSYLPTAKAYRATIRLGLQTSTDDLEGDIIASQTAKAIVLSQIIELLPIFIGSILQVPPQFSAIQIEGRRQYELARKGIAVEIPARPVRIDAIEVLDWRGAGTDCPEVDLAIACGPGTYIRSIARDLGEHLGVGGTLSHLIRTSSCGLHLDQSLTFEALEQQLEHNTFEPISLNQALRQMERLTLDEAYTHRWYFGQRLPIERSPSDLEPIPLFIQTEDAIPLGIGLFQEGVLSPKIVLPQSS